MGVDVSAEVMIGIEFQSDEEAFEFAKENGLLSKEYVEGEEENIGLDECLHFFSYVKFSEYTDRGGTIGIRLGYQELSIESGIGLAAAWSAIKERIPKEHHEQLDVHIWARYW